MRPKWKQFPMILSLAAIACCGLARRGSSQDYQANRIIVTTKQPRERTATSTARFGLTRNDFTALSKLLATARQVVPIREVRREARVSDRAMAIQMLGTQSEYASVHRLQTIRGRFLTASDVEQSRNVVVLGSRLAEKLFLGGDPIGKNIRVDRNYYLVVGTVEELRPLAYLPITTMKGRMGDRDITRTAGQFELNHFELSRIEIVPNDPADTPEMLEIITQTLKALHDDDRSYSLSVSAPE